jgi:phage terminase large subunit
MKAATAQLKKIQLPYAGWRPRPDQMSLWGYLEGGGLRACEVSHRRWGKDETAMQYTATAAMKRVGTYWHMLPQFGQCRKAIWEAINPRTGRRRIDDVFPQEIRAQTRETDMFIRFINDSTWQLVGSDSYNTLVGSPPVGLVFSEYALADPQAWAYLSPVLEENKGWVIFVSTSRGNNHLKILVDYAKVTPGWFAEILTADQTPVFTPAQLEQIKRDLMGTFGDDLGEAMFLQEYYCSFEGARPGSYYGKQMSLAQKDGRVTDVPWTSSLEVYTFWDLGVDDSTTIWFMQFSGMQIRVIDYYEDSGYGLEHYAKYLKAKPYAYGDHYMPHDVEVRELSGGEFADSRRDTAVKLGINPIITVPRARDSQAVMTGINAVRNILSRCWFDKTKCYKGISALEGYRAEYDEEKKTLANRPAHTWESHAADAFRTFALGYSPIKKEDNWRKHKPKGSWRAG